jgi:hypothetical protein
LKLVADTVLPDDRIFNDFVGKTKRTVALGVLEQKVKRTTVQKLNPRASELPGSKPERRKADPSLALGMTGRAEALNRAKYELQSASGVEAG